MNSNKVETMRKREFSGVILRFVVLAVIGLIGLVGLTSCGDTGTKGDVRSNWVIDGLLTRNGTSRFVGVYFDITRDDKAFISAVILVNGQTVRSLGDGTYFENVDTSFLGDTTLIEISTPLDQNFNFQHQIAVPDSFSFDFDQLPNNQVFASTNVVNVRWNASDFEGYSGGYFVVTEPASQASTAVGSFDLFDGQIGSISRDAFRNSQGEFQTGTYNVYVVGRVEQPINAPGLPFTIPEGIFSQNINRVGVKGQIGALYIAPVKTVTAVSGS